MARVPSSIRSVSSEQSGLWSTEKSVGPSRLWSSNRRSLSYSRSAAIQYELSPREGRPQMSEQITGKTVRFTLDPENPPQLTAEQRQRFESMRDEDIDLSDIPSQAGTPGRRPGIYGESVS